MNLINQRVNEVHENDKYTNYTVWHLQIKCFMPLEWIHSYGMNLLFRDQRFDEKFLIGKCIWIKLRVSWVAFCITLLSMTNSAMRWWIFRILLSKLNRTIKIFHSMSVLRVVCFFFYWCEIEFWLNNNWLAITKT